jgi:hypothetical protein
LSDCWIGNARAGAYVRREAIPGAEIEIGVGQQVPAVNFVIGMVVQVVPTGFPEGGGLVTLVKQGVAALPIAWICER